MKNPYPKDIFRWDNKESFDFTRGRFNQHCFEIFENCRNKVLEIIDEEFEEFLQTQSRPYVGNLTLFIKRLKERFSENTLSVPPKCIPLQVQDSPQKDSRESVVNVTSGDTIHQQNKRLLDKDYSKEDLHEKEKGK